MNFSYKDYLDCKICKQSFSSCDGFSAHLFKEHGLSDRKYYFKHYKKKDLYNKVPIPFKSFEQYFLCDFTDKKNLKLWLDSQTKEKACEYLKQKLSDYCKLKGLPKAPNQAELKTISCLPSIETFHKICVQPYNIISESVELKNNFIYNKRYTQQELVPLTSGSIIIDTREQKPFDFDTNFSTVRSKLECGDYATDVDSKLVIERKSIMDFFSTLSGGLERFKKEAARARDNGIYIVVVVETTVYSALYGTRRFGKCSNDYVMRNMRQMCREFDNIQFVFSKDRKEALQKTLYILNMGDLARSIDLEYMFDRGEFVWH